MIFSGISIQRKMPRFPSGVPEVPRYGVHTYLYSCMYSTVQYKVDIRACLAYPTLCLSCLFHTVKPNKVLRTWTSLSSGTGGCCRPARTGHSPCGKGTQVRRHTHIYTHTHTLSSRLSPDATDPSVGFIGIIAIRD